MFLYIITYLVIVVCIRAVTRAINNLVAPDRLTSDAVDVRQELDLRIGILTCFLLSSFDLPSQHFLYIYYLT